LGKWELGKFLRKFGGDLAKSRQAVEDEVMEKLAFLSQKRVSFY